MTHWPPNYIQAVHVHNAFNTWQHMGFFRGGWIS
jgi:hypothetical protein